jgi:mRNA interferase MazF
VTTAAYCPKRGDVVWLSFTPQAGHEQAGHRPALTLSPESYNKKTGLALFCPMTTQVKNYPFEVPVSSPADKAHGVVLSDQVKILDWKVRRARFYFRAPDSVLSEVSSKLSVLLEG